MQVFAWILRTFDSTKEGVTPDGFVQMYKWMFEAGGKDENVIWRDLKFMGYNHALEQVGSRTFVLSLHSSTSSVSMIVFR